MAHGKNRNQQQLVTVSAVSAAFQGPIPPPEILIRYNEAQQGAADRIIHMAEGEQKHRHFMEKCVLLTNVVAEYFGLFLAGTLFAGIGYGGFWLITRGYQGAGIATVITAILGPLVTFLVERKKQQQPQGH